MMRPSRTRFSLLLLSEHEPQIALAALVHLRWFAVIGQVAATIVAAWPLGFGLPVEPVMGLIAFTAVTNLVLAWGMRLGRPPLWLVQAVLLADVLSLTLLLFFTGGSHNPFAVLYLVHVAMAVITLGAAWSWAVVAIIALCFGLLFRFNLPLGRPDPMAPAWVMDAGHWIALVLVAVLISAFIGHMERSLHDRELELAEMRERVLRNERLASLTTLAAGAAHELNTPLGTIAVVAKELEVMAGGAADPAAVVEDARLIRREVDRCRAILQRMRVDIGEDALSGDRVDVTMLLDYLREQLRPEETRRLRVELEARIREVVAPPRALEQALLVLLRNGFEASPESGMVTLSIASKDGTVCFEVADQGGGMSEEMLRRAGEPFFTTKEPGQGMGLGLFLVRLVAERCGAQFQIHSKVGQGTRCVLELRGPSENNASRPSSARTS